jgi:hypothetical protein
MALVVRRPKNEFKEKQNSFSHFFLNWEREDKHEQTQFGLVELTFKFKGIVEEKCAMAISIELNNIYKMRICIFILMERLFTSAQVP